MTYLKPLIKKDVIPFYEWLNNEDVIRYSLSIFQKINTKQDIDEWYNTLLENNDYKFGIFLKDSNKLIGYCGICNISNSKKEGEYFIFIGEKDQWGKGISTQCTKEIVRIGFKELQLNRITLTVSEPNIGGIKSYERAGFVADGNKKNASFRDGKFHNKIQMSIQKPDTISK